MTLSLANLSGLIVEAVADDEALPGVAVEMSRLMDAESVLVQTVGERDPAILSAHISPSLLVAYQRYFWMRDLWISDHPEGMAQQISVSDEYVSHSRMLDSEIYNDLLKAHGDIFRVMGFRAMVDGQKLIVGVHHTRSREFSPEDVHRLRHVQPALVGLVRARRRLEQRRGRFAEHIVDAEADPAMVVAADGRLHFANRAAARLLETGPLHTVAGRLVASDLALSRAVLLAVQAACHGRLGRTFTTAEGDLRIAVDPLDDHATFPRPAALATFALVRLRSASAHRAAAISAASKAWALTPAECALVDALLRGAAPKEHARSRGVSLATVRSQLRSLYEKAGANGRAELVHRLSDPASL